MRLPTSVLVVVGAAALVLGPPLLVYEGALCVGRGIGRGCAKVAGKWERRRRGKAEAEEEGSEEGEGGGEGDACGKEGWEKKGDGNGEREWEWEERQWRFARRSSEETVVVVEGDELQGEKLC
jgi:hypothetical protein